MPTIVIAGIDAGGNVPPTMGIARELRSRGWRVLVHGDDALRARAEAAGLEFVPVGSRQLDPLRSRATAAGLLDVALLAVDVGRAHEVVALARQVAADVALVDIALLRVIRACTGVLPTAVLCHTSWEITSRFAGPPYGSMLEAVGLQLRSLLAGADRILVASPAVLDRGGLPPNAVRTGAVLQDPPTPPRREGVPLVLVSASSFWYPRQARRLERMAAAVAGPGVRVLVTSGRAVDPSELRVPAGVELRGELDHSRVLPETSLLVGHGGHATTVRALAHDVPLLVVPLNPTSDQPRIGRAVARAGVGLVVPAHASPGRIRAAAATVLHRPNFAEAAARAGAGMRERDGAAVAADELARLVAHS